MMGSWRRVAVIVLAGAHPCQRLFKEAAVLSGDGPRRGAKLIATKLFFALLGGSHAAQVQDHRRGKSWRCHLGIPQLTSKALDGPARRCLT